MVNLSILSLTIAGVILPALVNAAACTDGLIYCGFNLRKKGHYTEEMGRELVKYGYEINNHNLNHGVYMCGTGGNGWIHLIKMCGEECIDGGSGKDDYCKGDHWGL